MAKIVNDPEYDTFKCFMAWACDNSDFLKAVKPESHPMHILAKFEGTVPQAKLKQGLKEAINDTLEDFSRWSSERVKSADDELKSLGCPTLTDMWLLFSNDLRRVEKPGRIQTEEECFLVRNAMEMSMVQSNPRRAKKLLEMMAVFEISK